MLGLNPNSAMADGGASNPLQEIQMRLQAPTAWMHGVIKVGSHVALVLINFCVELPKLVVLRRI